MLSLVAAAYLAATPFATMRRYGCYGSCPEYTIEVYEDGRVEFDGDRFVRVTGKASARLTRQQVSALHALFDDAKFAALPTEFNCEVSMTDQPMTKLIYRGKEILHDYGCGNAALGRLTKLEKRFDEIVNSERWTR